MEQEKRMPPPMPPMEYPGSAERRKRRRSILTAAVYAVLIVVAAVGIWIGVENTGKESSPRLWEDNILMSNAPISGRDYSEYTVFGSEIRRKQIKTITILDNLSGAPSDAWDVSVSRNGTVMAWVKPNGTQYDLFLGADGGIHATHCERLFAGYSNVEQVHFNGVFHTDGTKDMSEMFRYCSTLTELDLRDFNTAEVVDMSHMFHWCNNLTSLHIDNFDTSSVEDMSYMFAECPNITMDDVSHFDTTKVKDFDSFMQNSDWTSLFE